MSWPRSSHCLPPVDHNPLTTVWGRERERERGGGETVRWIKVVPLQLFEVYLRLQIEEIFLITFEWLLFSPLSSLPPPNHCPLMANHMHDHTDLKTLKALVAREREELGNFVSVMLLLCVCVCVYVRVCVWWEVSDVTGRREKSKRGKNWSS